MSHGRAIMRWGKHAGHPVRELPQNYLVWLASLDFVMSHRKWHWLAESIVAELKHRGIEWSADFLLPKNIPPEEQGTEQEILARRIHQRSIEIEKGGA